MTYRNNNTTAKKKNDDKQKLFGVLYFARLGTPLEAINLRDGTKKVFPYPRYTLNLALNDEEELELARNLGVTILDPTENVPFPHVPMMRQVKDGDADKARPTVKLLSRKGDATTIGSETLIGNGSEGTVEFYAFGDEVGRRGCTILNVTLTKLVKYEQPEESKSQQTKPQPTPAKAPSTNRKPVSYSKKQEPDDATDLDDEIPF